MNNARKPLAGLIALGAALAIPMAFAQEAQDPTASQDAYPTAQEATPTPQTTPEATSQPLTWADVDADGNGNLSREEAASVQSLAQSFDEADADSDGQLTPEEYKAFVAKADSAEPAPTDGGGND